MLAVTPVGSFPVSATAFLPAPLSVTATVNDTVLPTCAVPDAEDSVSAKSLLVVPPFPPLQALTSSAPSTEPSPVARLNAPPLAVNPVTPGTLLFPDGVAWNGFFAPFNSA